MAKTDTNNVVPLNNNAPPAEFAAKMREDAGKGLSTDQADNIVPFVNVLQPLSPQVNKQKVEFIEGAEPGDIWLKNAPNPIVHASEGVLFQHCHFYVEFVEWIPRERGGGFAGRYKELPADAKEIRDEANPQIVKHRRPNGNDLVQTRYHAGFVHTPTGVLPYVIPFTSSGHTVSRNWMSRMNTKFLPEGGVAPGYSCLYKLSTRQRQNSKGTWYVLDVSDAGWVKSLADYERGKALQVAFASGEKRAEEEDGHNKEEAPPF